MIHMIEFSLSFFLSILPDFEFLLYGDKYLVFGKLKIKSIRIIVL